MNVERTVRSGRFGAAWWALAFWVAVGILIAGCKQGPQGEQAVEACRTSGGAEACSNACDYLYEGKRYESQDDMLRNRQLLANVCGVSCRATGKSKHCENAKTGL